MERASDCGRAVLIRRVQMTDWLTAAAMLPLLRCCPCCVLRVGAHGWCDIYAGAVSRAGATYMCSSCRSSPVARFLLSARSTPRTTGKCLIDALMYVPLERTAVCSSKFSSTLFVAGHRLLFLISTQRTGAPTRACGNRVSAVRWVRLACTQ